MQAQTCGAKTRNGGICRNASMPNGKCRMHGGKSLGGIASPTLKTGKHSRYLPARLQERYQEALADDALLELNAEIALLDTRLTDLLTRVDSGESGALWQAVIKAFGEFRKAYHSGDGIEIAKAMTELDLLFVDAQQDSAAWGEIQNVVQQRRALVETERKRRVDMQQMIDSKQAMLLFGAVAGIIKARVSDRDTLAAISADLNGLLAARVSAGH